MNFKINILITTLIIISILVPLAPISAASAQVQLPIASPSNIVIVIDSSASTHLGDPTTGINFRDLIYQNAISITQSINRCSGLGIVAYGNKTIQKTDITQIKNEQNKLQIKKYIAELKKSYLSSYGRTITTNISDGLNTSFVMLQEVDGKKEIIIITDGVMDKTQFTEAMETVKKIDNSSVKIYFVQVLTASETFKKPDDGINKLSHVVNTEPIVLNPDERLMINSTNSTLELDESCLTPTPTSTIASTPMPTSTIVMHTPTINPTPQSAQQEIRTSWFKSSVNSIISWFKSIF